MPANPTSRSLGFVACGLAGALWGTGFFFGKIALREMAVGPMVLYRFLFAVAAILPLLVRRRPMFTAKDWRVLTAASFFGIPLQFLLQFKGLALTSLAHASLMVGTMPVILAAGAAFFLHERLDAIGWAALAGSTLGACLIAAGARRGAGNASLSGDALVVLSLIIALVWILGNKSLIARHDALSVSAWGLLLGTAMLAVWVCVQTGLPPVHGISPQAWVALAASGVLCTASTTLLWNWGLTQVPASQAGVFLNLEPIMGSLLGVLLFGERLGPVAWLGGSLIVLSAVVLTSRTKAAADQARLAWVE